MFNHIGMPHKSYTLTTISTMKLHRGKSRCSSEQQYLKHLACDPESLKKCINIYLGLQRERKGVSSALGLLSHLEKLDLTVADENDEDSHLPLLNHAGTLMGLTVTRE